MKLFRSAVIVIALVILASGCGEDPFTPEGGWSSTEISGVDLAWRVSGSNLEVELTAGTTGWVAVGFDSGYHMENANIIIAYVGSGSIYVRDDYGTAENVHQSDSVLGGEQNAGDQSGSEAGEVTTVAFTIPLDSGDLWDKKLEEGHSYQIVVMYGADGADDFTSSYQMIANGTITI
jgi:hypothetical protein